MSLVETIGVGGGTSPHIRRERGNNKEVSEVPFAGKEFRCAEEEDKQ